MAYGALVPFIIIKISHLNHDPTFYALWTYLHLNYSKIMISVMASVEMCHPSHNFLMLLYFVYITSSHI